MVAIVIDQTRVCSTYISKMDLGNEQPKVSQAKFQFNNIRRSVRHNHDLPIQ